MIKAKKITSSGSSAGEVELNARVFEVEPKTFRLHQYVNLYRRNQRQGTHSTKNRKEVRGGGAKPWRQKGTGRARAGTNNSPIWVGGGQAFGPKPRNYYTHIPRKLKRQALHSAFSKLAADDRIMIIEDLQFEKPKTSTIVDFLSGLELYGKKVLILNEDKNRNFELSCRNIPRVVYGRARLVNAYELLNADYLLLTESALRTVEEVFAE